MEIKITEKRENPLLERIEVTAQITFKDVTPSNKDVAAAVGKEVGKDAALVVVNQIHTQFGQKVAVVNAVAYNTTEAKEHAVVLTKHMKKKMEEEQKAAEEAKKKAQEEAAAAKEAEEKPAEQEEPKAEEAPEEKPAEETKEDGE